MGDFNQINTKKQGDVGLGQAIAWFTKQAYTVNIPLTDSQDYDLVVDKNNILQRVQVKTASFKSECNILRVSLSVKGGNRSGIGKIKKFDKSKVDLVFILSCDNECWLIPSQEINTTSTINLGDKYKIFKCAH